jgi:hypothetical protein
MAGFLATNDDKTTKVPEATEQTTGLSGSAPVGVVKTGGLKEAAAPFQVQMPDLFQERQYGPVTMPQGGQLAQRRDWSNLRLTPRNPSAPAQEPGAPPDTAEPGSGGTDGPQARLKTPLLSAKAVGAPKL